MASFVLDGDKELMKQLADLEKSIPDVCKKMVEAGCDVAYNAVKSRVPKRTGALEKSLKKTKGNKDKNGNWYCNFHFVGYDKKSASRKNPKGTANEMKAKVYEYGSPKQSAKPFIRPALDSAAGSIESAMKNIFDEESKKFK